MKKQFEIRFFLFQKPFKTTVFAENEVEAKRELLAFIQKSLIIDGMTVKQTAGTADAVLKEDFERVFGGILNLKGKTGK